MKITDCICHCAACKFNGADIAITKELEKLNKHLEEVGYNEGYFWCEGCDQIGRLDSYNEYPHGWVETTMGAICPECVQKG